MRRLDFRPLKKLRNPGRHLRALARWPERIVGQLPDAGLLAGETFWNFKIPVFSKLVEGRYATDEARRACLAALFAAAEAVERSERRPAGCRVAVLVTTPQLFDSEVTLFLNEDYFAGFRPMIRTERTPYDGGWVEGAPANPVELAGVLPPAPDGLEFLGGTRLTQMDDQWGEEPVVRTNWVWAFPRR